MGLGENGKALRAGERNNPPQFFFSGRAKICDYLEIAEERGELWPQGKENKQQQVLGKTL